MAREPKVDQLIAETALTASKKFRVPAQGSQGSQREAERRAGETTSDTHHREARPHIASNLMMDCHYSHIHEDSNIRISAPLIERIRRFISIRNRS